MKFFITKNIISNIFSLYLLVPLYGNNNLLPKILERMYNKTEEINKLDVMAR